MTDKQKHKMYLMNVAKQVSYLNLPFIECGVKYGSSAVRIASVINNNGYLFDTWKTFSGISKIDTSESRIKKILKRDSSDIKKKCILLIKKHELSDRLKLLQGDVRYVLPVFLKENLGLRFSIVHLDLDIYEPTKICLELLWEKTEGAIFIHDYGSNKWKGIKIAVDEFSAKHGIVIKKYDIEACVLYKNYIK